MINELNELHPVLDALLVQSLRGLVQDELNHSAADQAEYQSALHLATEAMEIAVAEVLLPGIRGGSKKPSVSGFDF